LGSEQQVTQETYRSLFWSHLNIDPHEARFGQLEALVKQHTSYKGSCASASEALQLLLSTLIEPKLSGLTVVRDFPQDQAALARLDADESGQVVAKRFEIYLDQVELANGYYELIDAHEQRARFEKDNRVRKELGRRQMELDEALISAMERGLPECSGVSIGLDRLLMAKLGCDRIDSVLLFPWQKI
jgi:lysyl-tRNA synthetase class 2